MEALGANNIASDFPLVDGDDLLNFSLDAEEIEGDTKNINFLKGFSSVSSSTTSGGLSSLPAGEEEELEWLLNKEAFPAVEYDILEDKPDIVVLGQHSPVSVLESLTVRGSGDVRSSTDDGISCDALQVPTGFPNFARKKRVGRKPRMGFGQHKHLFLVGHEINVLGMRNYSQESAIPPLKVVRNRPLAVGRRCLHCGADKTPQWRTGPLGKKTLCNACGVRYKSGRLVPEYRPACSPTFSVALHSNSHRKIMEMRRLKQEAMGQ